MSALDDLLPSLERHRDSHFRRLPGRRLRGEADALRFINEVGFCTAFTAGLGLPCLREAVAGRREPPIPEHLQHDYAIGTVWRLKDVLADKRLAYYGKALAGRPAFISVELLPAFLRLRVEPGGYLAIYRRGALAHCAKLVMDTLSKRGPIETRALRLASGNAASSKQADFSRAMKQLQESFLVLKVEERYDPFTYVWDTLERRWPDALSAARKLNAEEAAYRIVRRYFETAGYGAVRTTARLLGIAPQHIERAVLSLARERLLAAGVKIAGAPGGHYVLSQYVGGFPHPTAAKRL